jgi:hypothetical protein
MSSTLATVDKALSGQLKNSLTRNLIRVVLVVYILLITSLSYSTLSIFESTLFQIAYLALLAYMALLDPASALLMAAAYLFTLQQLNKPEIRSSNNANNIMNRNNNNVNNANNNVNRNNNNVNNANNTMNRNNNNVNNANNTLNILNARNNRENFEETLMPTLSNVPTDPSHEDHPAFKTMTENLAQAGVFTSDLQFKDAQSNYVPDIDQTASIKTLTNQFSAQGVDLPRGFDLSIYSGYEL